MIHSEKHKECFWVKDKVSLDKGVCQNQETKKQKTYRTQSDKKKGSNKNQKNIKQTL